MKTYKETIAQIPVAVKATADIPPSALSTSNTTTIITTKTTSSITMKSTKNKASTMARAISSCARTSRKVNSINKVSSKFESNFGGFCKYYNGIHSLGISIISTQYAIFLIILLILIFMSDHFAYAEVHKVTAKLISNHNYPVEEHTVHTPDDYILTIYRIPSSSKNLFDLESNDLTIANTRPVVFLQHGILCASDDWIINGPDTSLAYMFADAGYDVWLGNARGNTYSRQHKHKHPDTSEFWNFSWHEIGVYDLAAMLDYALDVSNVSSLHFVAHSQGTTTFFVLMSSLPQYNQKVKTVHLLAPIAFMKGHSFIGSKIGRIFLGYPSFLSWLLGGMELLPITSVQKLFCEQICSSKSIFRFFCSGLLDFLGGWGTQHLNYTLLPHVCETHPAGASTSQIIHYLQLFSSGNFRQFDHGIELNKKYYQQETPPSYEISNITSCVQLYYSNNDYMSAVEDVEYLAKLLPCAELYRIPYEDWNHYDFLWSNNVKEVINDRILNKINQYEKEGLLKT